MAELHNCNHYRKPIGRYASLQAVYGQPRWRVVYGKLRLFQLPASVSKVIRHGLVIAEGTFSWLVHPYNILMLAGLVLLSGIMGVWSYQQPLVYHLSIGGADAPYIRDVGDRIPLIGSSRELRGDSVISIPGVSATHPLTLSVHLSGSGRKDIASGQVVSFTLNINGKDYTEQRLGKDGQWYSWRIKNEDVMDGRLDITFKVPPQFSGILTKPIGMIADQLDITPDSDSGIDLSPYSELDWRNILYLAAIVLLIYSFFGGVRSSRSRLCGLILSVTLSLMLWLSYSSTTALCSSSMLAVYALPC